MTSFALATFVCSPLLALPTRSKAACSTGVLWIKKLLKGRKAEAADDPVLLELIKDHRGKLLHDDDSDGHYVLTEVNLVEWAKHKHWSATSTPAGKIWALGCACVSHRGGGGLVRTFTITARCKLLP
jgi:hypothetical protein